MAKNKLIQANKTPGWVKGDLAVGHTHTHNTATPHPHPPAVLVLTHILRYQHAATRWWCRPNDCHLLVVMASLSFLCLNETLGGTLVSPGYLCLLHQLFATSSILDNEASSSNSKPVMRLLFCFYSDLSAVVTSYYASFESRLLEFCRGLQVILCIRELLLHFPRACTDFS
jgi:hypothetical protein